MGADLSTCCGDTYKADEGVGLSPQNRAEVKRPAQTEVASYAKKLEHGTDVKITLGDASRLLCDLHYAKEVDSLYISCRMQGERRVRPITLASITSVLHTPSEIATLEQAAGVKDSDHCVALCMESAGGCLPLFFDTADEKRLFVAFMSEVKKSTR